MKADNYFSFNCFLDSIVDSATKISDIQYSDESIEYEACSFIYNEKKVLFRSAKVTPKKIGQFVTIWKRSTLGITEPYTHNDQVDFLVIAVKNCDKSGYFVFPQSVLVEQGIFTSDSKPGKRGFRLYPSWDIPVSIQAKKTQEWQRYYFFNSISKDSIESLSTLFFSS